MYCINGKLLECNYLFFRNLISTLSYYNLSYDICIREMYIRRKDTYYTMKLIKYMLFCILLKLW